VLSFAEGAALTPTQIQKALFLIQQNLPESAPARPKYDFVPYQHGPYAPQVNIDAYDLVMEQFAQATRGQHQTVTYRLTMAGSLHALTLRCDIGADAAARVQQIASWVRGTSLDTIVREIGRQYPQYQTAPHMNARAA
jgi:hypothetical protein